MKCGSMLYSDLLFGITSVWMPNSDVSLYNHPSNYCVLSKKDSVQC